MLVPYWAEIMEDQICFYTEKYLSKIDLQNF
jgi:hypothetical protein